MNDMKDAFIGKILKSSLESKISNENQGSVSTELRKKIDDLHEAILKVTNSFEVVNITQRMLNEWEIEMYNIVERCMNEIDQDNMSTSQYIYILKLGEIVVALTIAMTLYDDASAFNQINSICSITKELENMDESSIKNLLELFKNKDEPEATTSFDLRISKNTWADIDFPKKLQIHNSLHTFPRDDAHTFLLYGPPGTGKTMLASVIASDFSNSEYYYFTCSTLLAGTVGETETKLKKLFDTSIANAPRGKKYTFVFDEFDFLFSQELYVKTLLLVIQTYLGSSSGTLQNNVAFIAITNFLEVVSAPMIRRLSPIYFVDVPKEDVLFKYAITELYSPFKRTSFTESLTNYLIKNCEINLNKLKALARTNEFVYTYDTINTAIKSIKQNAYSKHDRPTLYTIKNKDVIIFCDDANLIKKLNISDMIKLTKFPFDTNNLIIIPSAEEDVSAGFETCGRSQTSEYNKYLEIFNLKANNKKNNALAPL